MYTLFTVGKIIILVASALFGIWMLITAFRNLRIIDKDERLLQDYAKLVFRIFIALMAFTLALNIILSLPVVGEFIIEQHNRPIDNGDQNFI